MNLCMTWLQEALRGAKTTDQGLSPHRSVLLCGLTGRMAPAGGSGSPFCSTSALVPLRCFTPHSCWLKSLEPERVLLLSLSDWLTVCVYFSPPVHNSGRKRRQQHRRRTQIHWTQIHQELSREEKWKASWIFVCFSSCCTLPARCPYPQVSSLTHTVFNTHTHTQMSIDAQSPGRFLLLLFFILGRVPGSCRCFCCFFSPLNAVESMWHPNISVELFAGNVLGKKTVTDTSRMFLLGKC